MARFRNTTTKSVGTSVVVLLGPSPSRRALLVGIPLGAAGAWVTLGFAQDPTSTVGLPLFFGGPPLILTDDDFG